MVIGFGERKCGFWWVCSAFACIAALLVSCQGDDTSRSPYGSSLDADVSVQGAGEEVALSEEELEQELEKSFESGTLTEMNQTSFNLWKKRRGMFSALAGAITGAITQGVGAANSVGEGDSNNTPRASVQVLVIAQDSNDYFQKKPGASGSVEGYRATVRQNLESLVSYAAERESELEVAMVTYPGIGHFQNQNNVRHIYDTVLSAKSEGKFKKTATSLRRAGYLAFAKKKIKEQPMAGYLNSFWDKESTKIIVNFSPSSACKLFISVSFGIEWCDWVRPKNVKTQISHVYGADQISKFRFYTALPHHMSPEPPVKDGMSGKSYHKLAQAFWGKVYHSNNMGGSLGAALVKPVTVPWSEILHGEEE